MKNLKTSVIVLLVALGLFSCTKPEPAPTPELRPVETAYSAPCEPIKYIDFETATNWFGILSWATPLSNNTDTYKLKVWQLKTGQNNLSAVTNNVPILVKNINSTNLTANASGQLEALIEPINTHVVDAIYTATIIYIVETYNSNNIKECEKANSYRYSRSNKQKG